MRKAIPLLDRVLERIADNESPRYFAVDGKARHETGTRFSKLNNLPMDLMREEIHTGVLIAVDVVPPLYFIPAGYGDMRTFRDIVARLDDDRPIYGLWPPKAGLVEGLRNKPVHWLDVGLSPRDDAGQPDGIDRRRPEGLPEAKRAPVVLRRGFDIRRHAR